MMTLEQRISRLVEVAIKNEMRSIFHDDGLIYTLEYRLRDLDIDYADIFEPYLIEDTDEERKKMYSMCGKVAERVFGEITQKMKAALEMVESSFIHEKSIEDKRCYTCRSYFFRARDPGDKEYGWAFCKFHKCYFPNQQHGNPAGERSCQNWS